MKLEFDSPQELAKYGLAFLCVGGVGLVLAATHVITIGPDADLLGGFLTPIILFAVAIGVVLLSASGVRWLWLRRAR